MLHFKELTLHVLRLSNNRSCIDTIVFIDILYMYFYICCAGHFLHLRLLPNGVTRTLKSPIFGMTKDTCRLDMFVHQSNNKNGKLRIVIERVNSSSWVPIEKNGNDHHRWTELTFPIGRVSQAFRILFEIVSNGIRPSQRGHVR